MKAMEVYWGKQMPQIGKTMSEKLWAVTLTPEIQRVIKGPPKSELIAVKAQTCDEQNGALVFRGGENLSIKLIIAAGQWVMVEREAKDK